MLVLGDLLPESQQPKLPADLCQRQGAQTAAPSDLVLATICGNVFASAELCAVRIRVAHGAHARC